MESQDLIEERMSANDSLRNVVNAFYRIGPRNVRHYQGLQKAQLFLELILKKLYSHSYLHEYVIRGKKFHNVVAEKTGKQHPKDVLIIGAHYNSHRNSPGCNDNASAIAVLLKLADDLTTSECHCTVRFVCFANSEGSRAYARFCRKRNENILGMICLDTLGEFSEESSKFSFRKILGRARNPFAIVSNKDSEGLMKKLSPVLQQRLNIDEKVVSDYVNVDKTSDHVAFWKESFPAVMVVRTESIRSPYYHSKEDTPEKIDYNQLTSVYEAVREALSLVI